MVVGLDIEVADWQAMISREKTRVFVCLAILIVIVLGSTAAVVYRHRLPPEKQGVLQYIESVEIALLGIALTLMGAVALHEHESLARSNMFDQLALAQGNQLVQAFVKLRDYQSGWFLRFFNSSDEVGRDEFRDLAAAEQQPNSLYAFGWAPRVALSEKDVFESHIQAQGFSDFIIYEKDHSDQKIPVPDRDVYYPLLYVEPHESNLLALGFDLLSESRRANALLQALQTGLPTASHLVRTVHLEDEVVLVYAPVNNTTSNHAQNGVLLTAIHPQNLLTKTQPFNACAQNAGLLEVSFYQLEATTSPKLIASSNIHDQNLTLPATHLLDIGNDYLLVVPILMFGKSYALIVQPTADFFASSPLWIGWLAGMFGGILTIMLTVFSWLLVRRRASLEAMVAIRTQELRASEERFRRMLEVVPTLAVQGYAMDGTTQYWNRASELLYGYAAEEAIGENLIDLIIPPEMRTDVEQAIEQMARTGEAIPASELALMRKDGSRVVVFSNHAIVVSSNQPPELFCIDIDLTALKQAEKAKQDLEHQLRQSQKMEAVGRLAGGVAHDFNNTLQSVMGNVFMALDGISPDSPIVKYLKAIETAGNRSAEFTRQLLAFARKQIVDPQILNINETVTGMVKLLQRLIGEDIDLVWDPAPEIWLIKIDPTQLDQILLNIVLNSRDAIHGVGKITIETKNVEFDKSYCHKHPGFFVGQFVRLTIKDNGVGMGQDILGHIFEPFFTTKPIDQGTGLGLATVFGIVQQNNGFIKVASKVDYGTTVDLYFPRVESNATPEDGLDTESINHQPVFQPVHETILLVEDQESVLNLTYQLIKQIGYQVFAKVSPQEALQLAQEYHGEIHLLLTDVVMPEMGGYELWTKLKEHYPEMKCLFMSGYTGDIVVQHGVNEQDICFMEKPFSAQKLAMKIREVLDS